ncbi:hypothetical protein EVAR_87228_1 [Eumeta japonica]|uniref:Uncharacterized protein n=1 Tax=Eumeta variegata TaxID=151549 RepID=A0A4C1ZSI6_EUMVA|nr:hypothetical protein EVAR_87228_1 [Eumeta japonica]
MYTVVNSTIEPSEKRVAQLLAHGDASPHQTHYYLWTLFMYSIAWRPRQLRHPSGVFGDHRLNTESARTDGKEITFRRLRSHGAQYTAPAPPRAGIAFHCPAGRDPKYLACS